MKLVCKYCKEEITTLVSFQVEGKMKQNMVCLTCFNNYLKTMHDIEEDFKIRSNSPHWKDD